VNKLFATLMLGLQRLDETGVVAAAHHSMLEDVLGGYKWNDADSLM
jgi:hypothetical protein